MTATHRSILRMTTVVFLVLYLFSVNFGQIFAQDTREGGFSVINGPTTETFSEINPLKIGAADCAGDPNCLDRTTEFSKPAGILSRALFFAFPIAGLILFVMLIWAGFEMLSGASTKKSLDAGKQRATSAIIGFFLLFVSYWIARLLEVIFGITIL